MGTVNTNTLQKVGKTVIAKLQLQIQNPVAGQSYTIGTIPEGYRPNSSFEVTGGGSGSAWKNTDMCVFRFMPDGNLVVDIRGVATANWYKVETVYFAA